VLHPCSDSRRYDLAKGNEKGTDGVNG